MGCGENRSRRRRRGRSMQPAQVAEGLRLAWSRAGGRAPLPAARALPLPPREPGCQGARDRAQCRLEAPRRGGCRSGSPPPAAAPHPAPAAAPRAMGLPRGLLVAWALSLWPGTCRPCPPFPWGPFPGPPGPRVQLPGAGRGAPGWVGPWPLLGTLVPREAAARSVAAPSSSAKERGARRRLRARV